MVATRVGKDKSQRSTIKIMNEIMYLAALPSSQVLNCIPAPYNRGFVGGRGETRKELISKAGKSNNLFMWNFFQSSALGKHLQNEMHEGNSGPLGCLFFVFLSQIHVNHKLLPYKRKFQNPQHIMPAPPPPSPPARPSPQDMWLAWTSHWPHLARWARGSTIHHPEGDKSFSWSISAGSGGKARPAGADHTDLLSGAARLPPAQEWTGLPGQKAVPLPYTSRGDGAPDGGEKRKPTTDAGRTLPHCLAFRAPVMPEIFPVRADQASQGTSQELAANGANSQTGPQGRPQG